MRMVSTGTIDAFLAEKPIAVVHFDAEWVTYRDEVRKTMDRAAARFGDLVSFAEVDVDEDVVLAKALDVVNIPLIAYFRDGELAAMRIGDGDHVEARIVRMLRGESPLTRAERREPIVGVLVGVLGLLVVGAYLCCWRFVFGMVGCSGGDSNAARWHGTNTVRDRWLGGLCGGD
jgi:thiol-disulfide isomerase/thioredoxin